MFTHVDEKNLPTMVDVSEKGTTLREAVATTKIFLPDSVMDYFKDGEIRGKKGPVIQTAIIAGTMGAKKCSELIPFCHPIMLESIKVKIEKIDKNHLGIECAVKLHGKTGVEMEALTGAQVAALTIYDMCKAITHDMVISDCQLKMKCGGKRDYERKEV